MKRLALVTAAVAALVVAPVHAMTARSWRALAQPVAAGDIIVSVSVFDGTMRPLDGVVIQQLDDRQPPRAAQEAAAGT